MRRAGALLLGLTACGVAPPLAPEVADQSLGVLLAPAHATDAKLQALRAAGCALVVLDTGAGDAVDAAARVRHQGLTLGYWIEVGRCPELADRAPALLASLQGHPEWRRHFPDAPEPTAAEVVKAWPWVPILTREGFAAQQARVAATLAALPEPALVLLNDLQGGPSACGCGNVLCRWAVDYGPKQTATPYGPEAAAAFLAALRARWPGYAFVPVWTTECEAHESAPDGACAGVPCFEGLCWRKLDEQWRPLARQSRWLGVLAPFRVFGRQDPAWVQSALDALQARTPDESQHRWLAVLQGFDVDAADIERQVAAARAAGAWCCVVAEQPIEQSYQPRLVPVRR